MKLESSLLSATSKTTDAMHTTAKQSIVSAKYNVLDVLFPLFDQMLKQTGFFEFILQIFSIALYAQILSISLWSDSRFFGSLPLLNKITSYIMFYDVNAPFTSAIVFFVVSTLSSIWIGFVISYYKAHHNFIPYSLHPCRLIFEVIPIFLIPSGSLAGQTLFHIGNGASVTNVISMILSLLSLLQNIIIFYFAAILINKSVYLTKSPFTAFNPNPHIYLCFISTLFAFLASVSSIYTWWFILIFQIAHLLANIVNLKNFCFLIYHRFYSNIIVFTVVICISVWDLIMFIGSFLPAKPINQYIILGVCGVVLIISFAASEITLRFMKKRVKKILDTAGEYNETNRNEYYQSLNLAKNDNTCIMFIKLGMEFISPCFLDWSLIKYLIMQNEVTDTVRSVCSQIVALFPFELRLLNILTNSIFKQQSISFSNRYLGYQLYKLKDIRQTSSIVAVSELYDDLKKQTNQTITFIQSVWESDNCDGNTLSFISQSVDDSNHKWAEALMNYPNNAKIREEHAKYLIEGTCDFEGAIIEKMKANSIENGHFCTVDNVFLSLIAFYPYYLKHKVLDRYGRRITTKAANAESSKGSSSFGGREDTSIDMEEFNNVSKQLIKQPKVKITLCKALETKKSKYADAMIPIAFFAFLVIIIPQITLFVRERGLMIGREETLLLTHSLARTRFYQSISQIGVILYNSQINGLFNDSYMIEDMIIEDGVNKSFLPLDLVSLSKAIMHIDDQSLQYLSNLLDEVAQTSENGEDPYALASKLFQNGASSLTCSNGNVSTVTDSNFASIMSYSHLLTFLLLMNATTPDIMNQNPFCEYISNYIMTFQYIPGQIDLLAAFLNTNMETVLFEVKLFMTIIPPVMLASIVIALIVNIVLFYSEVERISDIIFHSSFQTKGENVQTLTTIPKSYSVIYQTILMVFVTILACILVFLMFYNDYQTNLTFVSLNQWQNLSAKRAVFSADSLFFSLFALRSGEYNVQYLSPSGAATLAQNAMQNLEVANRFLFQGYGTVPSSTGFNSEYDNINLVDTCVTNASSGNDTIHDLYKCSSANNLVSTYITILETSLQYVPTHSDEINITSLINSIHLANSHLWSKLDRSLDIIPEVASANFSSSIQTMSIYVVFGILISFVLVFAFLSLRKRMNRIYAVTMSLLMQIQPTKLIANKELMNIILNKSSRKSKEVLSTSEHVLHDSSNAVILTSGTGTIEFVNQSVSNLLGYSPEQLLGQMPSMFFKKEDSTIVVNKMEMMNNFQEPLLFESNVTCIADNESLIPCTMTMMGTKGSEKNLSFIYILKDMSKLVNQRKEAEEAKASSEKLLYQILPRDIVLKLNSGEKDINFSVPSATIIFIDIVKFSEYASNLTAVEIMSNLSLIFASFDSLVQKFPIITKIKLIGDVYMAAGGLFGDSQVSEHAEQIVKFGLEAISALDDINVRLNASLSVRVGVNTGGPIIAGVLGTEKPAFDIIGDPINVASRLQSTDIPGRVQVSQSTMNALQGLGFDCEKRGDVFLKGKGIIQSYFVNKAQASILLSSIDNDSSVI